MHLSFRAAKTGTLDEVELPRQHSKMSGKKNPQDENTQVKDDPQITTRGDVTAIGTRSQKHRFLFYKLWESNPEPSSVRQLL